MLYGYSQLNSLYPMNHLGFGSLSIPDIMILVLFSYVPVIWSPSSINQPSHFIYFIMYIIVYVPSVLYILLLNEVNIGVVLFLISLLISLKILSFATCFKVEIYPRFETSYKTLYIVAVICVILLIIVFESAGVLRLEFWNYLDLSGIYQRRDLWGSAIQSYPNYLERIVPLFTSSMMYVVLPWIFIQGLISRSPPAIIISSVGWLNIFTATGYRSALVIPISIFGIYFFRQMGLDYLSILLIGSLSSILAGLLMHKFGIFGYSLQIVQRIFTIPGITTGLYLDFFSENPHTYYLSRTFGFYPYDDPNLYNMLMKYYFGQSGSLNSNLWSMGFARFGYIGPLVLTLLFSPFVILIDSFSRKISTDISVLLVIPFLVPITNSALLTMVLIHGLPILLLLLFVHPSAPSAVNR